MEVAKNNENNLKNAAGLRMPKKAFSCKGGLYYSSGLKSGSRNPFCVGIIKYLPRAPRNLIGETEFEASKTGRSLANFRYGCVGYSVYSAGKNSSTNKKEKQPELPICFGLEILVNKKIKDADTFPGHVHHREGYEFLSSFSRSSSMVAMGVAKNVRIVGNHMKGCMDNVLDLYRRRPK